MQMNFNAVVDLQKLSTSMPLLPLFEAIVNSIQSIEELEISDGKIDIKVIRENTLLNTGMDEQWKTDIEAFEITDNGVGFNDKNYESFDIYGSTHKSQKGCKGVGRITWLKAFSKVEVESTYEKDGKYYDRDFSFSIANERELQKEQESSKTQTGTKVTLDSFITKYKKQCPKLLETLARDIMNHCFAYFVLSSCPVINISDDDNSICINNLFNESIKGQISTQPFTVKGREFQIINAKNFAPSSTIHMLHFCAHQREVYGDKLSKIIKNLTGKLTNEDGEEFVYAGYIIGEVLDESLNSERTNFDTLQEELEVNEQQVEIDGLDNVTEISKKDIVDAVIPIIEEYLKTDIDKYSAKTTERIQNYVKTNPRYRSLLKHYEDGIGRIPFIQEDDKLELELFKQEQAYRLLLKKDQKKFLEEDINSIKDYSEYTQKCTEYMEKISDAGKDDLADYIMHRKVMLDILSKNLEYVDDEKKRYALEKQIHKIIFPMQATSDEIDYEKHNLWIIDEKLAYHYYLASDKPIESYDIVESDCGEEPDIAIFEPAFALTGDSKDTDVNNITIIEFKRPDRTDKDCIDQVMEYVDKIRKGKAKDSKGRTVAENTYQSVRFTCYVLCDVSADMADFLRLRGYRKTPDGKSFYFYNDDFNTYIEVVPYNKIVQDSKMRNKMLFDKLFCQ